MLWIRGCRRGKPACRLLYIFQWLPCKLQIRGPSAGRLLLWLLFFRRCLFRFWLLLPHWDFIYSEGKYFFCWFEFVVWLFFFFLGRGVKRLKTVRWKVTLRRKLSTRGLKVRRWIIIWWIIWRIWRGRCLVLARCLPGIRSIRLLWKVRGFFKCFSVCWVILFCLVPNTDFTELRKLVMFFSG